jgi:DNA-binding Lrp family transcriptional regulator
MIDARDRRLLAALQDGLPFVERPYAAVGARIGMPEDEVIARLRALLADGVIRRFGLVVRHRELGYDANAMAVWDVPDDRVDEAGRRIAGIEFVTLCYRRPRRPPDWPYNLFCMIHGRDRDTVRAQVRTVTGIAGLEARPHAVLFSGRRFKQRGAIFSAAPAEAV